MLLLKRAYFNLKTALSYNKDRQQGKPPQKTLNHCKI
jgi:hypothetical protein